MNNLNNLSDKEKKELLELVKDLVAFWREHTFVNPSPHLVKKLRSLIESAGRPNIEEAKCSACGHPLVPDGFETICKGCLQFMDDRVKTADMEMDKLKEAGVQIEGKEK